MRPLFTLPLPDNLLAALCSNGYSKCEELFEGNAEYQQKALNILMSFNLNFEDIKALMEAPGSITAAQHLRNDQMNESIPTFSEVLDRILGGGVQTGSAMQICGPPGSGKTQLVLQLSVNVHLPCSLGGLEGESVFIDTESTFCVKRLRKIATSAWEHCAKIVSLHNLKDDMATFTIDSILSGVHYIATGNIFQLMAAIQRLYELIENNEKIKCIVIDSFTLPFLRISNHLERTRHVSITIQKLHQIAVKHNVAVVLTNHLTTKINLGNKVLAPSLGESFSHCTSNILLLGKLGNSFSAVMYKSFKLPENVVCFQISSKGVRDIHT